MAKITKLRLHLLKSFRENYWLLFSGHGVYYTLGIQTFMLFGLLSYGNKVGVSAQGTFVRGDSDWGN